MTPSWTLHFTAFVILLHGKQDGRKGDAADTPAAAIQMLETAAQTRRSAQRGRRLTLTFGFNFSVSQEQAEV